MSAIEVKPFGNEQEVPIGDSMLRLAVDFRMIDLLEGLLGRTMDDLLVEICVPNPPHNLTVKLVWAMLRKHHSDLSLDQVAALMYSEHKDAIALAAGTLVRQAFHLFESEEEGEQSPRPPKRKRSSGASRPSSRSGARPASPRATSGRKRRAAS